MSVEPDGSRLSARDGAARLRARASLAESCAERRLKANINDLLLPEEHRLDDRTRATIADLIEALIDITEGDIRQHGARLLEGRGETAMAKALKDQPPVADRLRETGLFRHPDLMRELIGRARQDVLAGALSFAAPGEPDRPSLIARLVHDGDRVVASAAAAMMVADNRRHHPIEGRYLQRTDLPAEWHHRLVWSIAAALRDCGDTENDDTNVLDRALSEAALRSLAAHDEGDRLEAAAMRLAAAIDARPEKRGALLGEALADSRLALFIALLAHALGLPYEAVRDIVLDPVGDRLWLALRALDLDRDTIAAIGLALGETDPRRDVDAFAALLNTIMAVSPAEARATLAPLTLHPDYRAAIRALNRADA